MNCYVCESEYANIEVINEVYLCSHCFDNLIYLCEEKDDINKQLDILKKENK